MRKSALHPRSRKTPRGGRMIAIMILQISEAVKGMVMGVYCKNATSTRRDIDSKRGFVAVGSNNHDGECSGKTWLGSAMNLRSNFPLVMRHRDLHTYVTLSCYWSQPSQVRLTMPLPLEPNCVSCDCAMAASHHKTFTLALLARARRNNACVYDVIAVARP